LFLQEQIKDIIITARARQKGWGLDPNIPNLPTWKSSIPALAAKSAIFGSPQRAGPKSSPRDTGIELVRLWDESRLFWHKSNSNDPDRNVWSIFVFPSVFDPGARHSVDPATPISAKSAIFALALFDEFVMEGPAIRALIAAAVPWLVRAVA
jgi:hypothetical protein